MARTKLTLALSDEALAIINESAASERKRGELVSSIVEEWAQRQRPRSEGGVLERIEQSLERIEARLVRGVL